MATGIFEQALYTKKELIQEYGNIFSVELLPNNHPDILAFIESIKEKTNPKREKRRETILALGEEIKSIWFELDKTTVGCGYCHFHGENKYSTSDKDYWICWRDWNTTNKYYIHPKTYVGCPYIKYSPLRTTHLKLTEKYPEIFGDEPGKINVARFGWVLYEMKLTPRPCANGWKTAKKNSNQFERQVKEKFRASGSIEHNRWIKILCDKGTRFRQVDALFQENNFVYIIEVKNWLYGDAIKPAIIQTQRYWQLLKLCPQFNGCFFSLFLVNFGPDTYLETKFIPEFEMGHIAPATILVNGNEATKPCP